MVISGVLRGQGQWNAAPLSLQFVGESLALGQAPRLSPQESQLPPQQVSGGVLEL